MPRNPWHRPRVPNPCQGLRSEKNRFQVHQTEPRKTMDGCEALKPHSKDAEPADRRPHSFPGPDRCRQIGSAAAALGTAGLRAAGPLPDEQDRARAIWLGKGRAEILSRSRVTCAFVLGNSGTSRCHRARLPKFWA